MESAAVKDSKNKDIPDPIMTKVSSFPNMPQAAIKLRELLAKEDVAVDEIEEILRHDPGLATNVLRLANSAFFGVPRKVETLKRAVMLLGVKRFAQIAVSAGKMIPPERQRSYCIFECRLLLRWFIISKDVTIHQWALLIAFSGNLSD